jgi:hypothetical protein
MADREEYEVEVDIINDNGYTPVGEVPAVSKDEEDTTDESKKQKPRVNKRRERIDEMTRKFRTEERNTVRLTQEAEQRQQQYTDLEKRAQQAQMDSARVVYQTLNQNKSILEANLKYARERGDTDAENAINDQLTDTRVRVQRVREYYPQVDQAQGQQQQIRHGNDQPSGKEVEQPAAQTQKPAAKEDQVPDAGLDWVDANAFIKDRSDLHQIVNQHDQILRAKGIDPASTDFYVQLTKRLKDDFPEDAAKLLVERMSFDDDGDDDTGADSVTTETIRQKPSTGISDSGRSSPTVPRGKQKVKLSREEHSYCVRNNIEPTAYAKQKLLTDTQRNSNGYTNIR